MSEANQIILGVIFLAAVYVLTRYGVAWRIRRTCGAILKDLEEKKAFDPDSAAELPYAKTSPLRIGMRDYRPKALDSLIQDGFVGRTSGGRYFLKKGLQELRVP